MRNKRLSPRQARLVEAFNTRPQLMREEVDHIAGASNGPQVISELRVKIGLDIPCERLEKTDQDGRPCHPGRYYLTGRDREKISGWQEAATPKTSLESNSAENEVTPNHSKGGN